MKDIYELLNDVEIDLSQYNETRLSEVESRKIKGRLKNKIKHKKRTKRFAIAAAIFVLILTSAIGMINPGLAYGVPVVRSIIGEVMESIGSNGEYGEYAQIINRSVKNKGITITLKEVAVDNSVLQLAYTLESDVNIKEVNSNTKGNINGLKTEYYIDGKFLNAGSSRYLNFIDDYSCNVVETINIAENSLPDKFYLTATVAGAVKQNAHAKFNLIVSKDKMLKEIKEYSPEKVIPIGDAKLRIDKISLSPITTKLNYSSDLPVAVSSILLDDKGRIHQMIGGSGYAEGSGMRGDMIYNTISDDVKKLTVIPYVAKGDYFMSIDYQEVKGQYPIMLNQNRLGKLIINKVEFKEDKIIINYTAEGMAPLAQAEEIRLLDENKKDIMPVMDTWRNKVRDESKPLEFTAEFQAVKSSKFYIGTNDFSNYEFTDSVKIELDLNR